MKIIKAGGDAGPQVRDRFRREAAAMACLQHPGIVQIFDVGQQDETPFLAMEFVEGSSLAQRLREAPLPARSAAALLERLSQAVAYAHQRGVLHRDLTPANVLVTADGTPKITDFGLARLLSDETALTQSGAVMGTPSYLAPEQADGKARHVGPTADVYALGAILYECLTGRPPFRAATVLETLAQVVHDEPVSPRQLQSMTPRDLEIICLQCLRKDAARRFGSAAALAEDLRRWQAGEPIAARPVGALERAVKWTGRNRLVASLLTAVAVLLVGGTAVSAFFAWHASRETDRAREALAEQQTANEVKDEALGKLDQALAVQRDKTEEAVRQYRTAVYVRQLAEVQSAGAPSTSWGPTRYC